SACRTRADGHASLCRARSLREAQGADPWQGHHPGSHAGVCRQSGDSAGGQARTQGTDPGQLHRQCRRPGTPDLSCRAARSRSGQQPCKPHRHSTRSSAPRGTVMTLSASTLPGGMSAEEFLRDYWQKKPLLIRQAFPGFESPLSADELAGLSLEEEVESRIVLEHGATPWELRRGPFTEDSYRDLPARDWTLLVQAVDQFVPEVAEILDQFRFLPSWRVDDLMISFAAPGGSVGPHFDNYDVFLLQTHGHRRAGSVRHGVRTTPPRAATCREDRCPRRSGRPSTFQVMWPWPGARFVEGCSYWKDRLRGRGPRRTGAGQSGVRPSRAPPAAGRELRCWNHEPRHGRLPAGRHPRRRARRPEDALRGVPDDRAGEQPVPVAGGGRPGAPEVREPPADRFVQTARRLRADRRAAA